MFFFFWWTDPLKSEALLITSISALFTVESLGLRTFFFLPLRLSGPTHSHHISFWINLPADLISKCDVSELMVVSAVSTPPKASAASLALAEHPCMLRCSFSLSLRENLLSHTGQEKALSLVWIKWCRFRTLNAVPQWEHVWGLAPVWVLWCRCRALVFKNFFPHTWQQQDESRLLLSNCWSLVLSTLGKRS